MKSPVLSLSLLCFSFVAPAARAGEFFVDVLHGSDGNSGTSPAAAWKTLTHALATVASAEDLVHVAPGDYSTATGEVFPLHLGSAALLGDQGSAVTRIVGTGSEVLLVADLGNFQVVSLNGLGLLHAQTALSSTCTNEFTLVSTADVQIVDMTGYAIELDAHAEAGTIAAPSFQTNFDGLDVADCGGGIHLSATSPNDITVLQFFNSSIHDNGAHGFLLDSVGGGQILLSLTQTRVLRQGGAAVHANASGMVQIGISSSLVADNSVGVDVTNQGGSLALGAFFCTFAGNTGSAVHVEDGMPATSSFGGALFWGNGEDVTGGSVVTAQDSDSEHGAFGTANGNFSADPLFRNAALGDYSLTFGSLCIDKAGAGFVLDLDDAQRPADGDLDTHEALDVGAIEFNPLEIETTGQLGTQVVIREFGSPCMQTTLFIAPGLPAIAKKTAFGPLRLQLAGILPVLSTIVLSPDPSLTVATIPVMPSLVGQIVSLQSLTQSLPAPKGAALTNVETFTVIE